MRHAVEWYKTFLLCISAPHVKCVILLPIPFFTLFFFLLLSNGVHFCLNKIERSRSIQTHLFNGFARLLLLVCSLLFQRNTALKWRRNKYVEIGNVVMPLRKLKIDVNVFTNKCLQLLTLEWLFVVFFLLLTMSLFSILVLMMPSPFIYRPDIRVQWYIMPLDVMDSFLLLSSVRIGRFSGDYLQICQNQLLYDLLAIMQLLAIENYLFAIRMAVLYAQVHTLISHSSESSWWLNSFQHFCCS